MIKTILRIIILAALLVTPVVLLFLPADYFDTGETLCLSKRLLDIECLGCGLTRGIQHLIHFDFGAAWEFNKLTFFIFPLLVYLWITFSYDYFKKIVYFFENN